ncbi:molybdenum cofactor cytidylyltransferase [Mucilaginibacter yixingensis]|uniref:Molybdenum cofactor cytidylyltransferase n=1 Tax=Mucilaginibacter yixingensis TaxID=1295612 RepID=A0A2T5JFF9_9SPHI|nr:nucleotidyltransferase family protein [Mucilaginibacter yixingensis]PTR01076.1 molybdenum cofactor cytidylyltransferase [Mucilaginibacter yixingensis]
MTNIGTIILAAGGSSRMGQPKQLLRFKNKTMLRHTVDTVLESTCGDGVVVVTGAVHQQLADECDGLPVSVIENSNWQMGMSTSIRAGLKALEKMRPDNLRGVLIILCDQPFITAGHLDNLADMFTTRGYRGIAATGYDSTVGAPAIFSRDLFEQLYQLNGDKGAKELINNPENKLLCVPFHPASIDLDTMDDYLALTP